MGPRLKLPSPHGTPHYVVTLLGGFQLLSFGNPLKLPAGKATELFAYLLLNPTVTHYREALVELFWETAPPERGQRRLSNTLYQLQKIIGEGWFLRDNSSITLNPTVEVTVDVWQLESWAKSSQIEDCNAAIALYRGELLPEIYHDWVLAKRVALRDTYIALLLNVAQDAERQGELLRALELYRQLATAEPLYEEGQRGVIRTLLGLERSIEALAYYQKVKELLNDELNVLPAPPTQALGEQAEQVLHARQAVAAPSNPFVRPPFVGRTTERAHLLALLQQATLGQGGLGLLLGEAGIGKSRLLEEVAAAATWRGWQVVWGRGQELTLPSPYTPFQEAIVAALPPTRRQQLKHRVQPLWLNILGQAFPPLADMSDGSTFHQQEFQNTERLALAIQRILEPLQQITPHLFILDDVQWADESFWKVMNHLREPLAQSHCLLLLAGRAEELKSDSERWEMIDAWSRDGMPTLTLEGLKATDLTALIRTVTPDEAGDPQKLHRATNGNPLLTLAMLQATDTPYTTPPPLKALFHRRISHLSLLAHKIVQAAALLGYRFAYEHLAKVVARAGLESGELLTAMGELENRGLILLEAEGYRFQHDTLRRTIYEAIPPAVQLYWHRHILAVLVEESFIAPTHLLHHAEQAGDEAAIIRYAMAAGRMALAGYAMASASHYFTRALELLPTSEQEDRYQALLGRLQAENILGNRVAQLRDLELLQEIATQSDNAAWQAEAREQAAYYYWSVGSFQEAATTIEAGLAIYADSPNPKREAALRVVLGRIVREWGQYHEARQQITLARSLYRQLGDRDGDAIATDLLGGIAWQMGNHSLGADLHQQAAELFRANGNIIREAQALNNLGANLWSLERYLEARATHERALPLCREQGHRRGEADNLDNMGGVAWILGDYETAIDLYSQALTIRRSLKDRWGMAISLGNLGSAYRLWGKAAEALPFYEEAITLNQELARKHGLGYTLHGQGLAFLALGEDAAAEQALFAATEIRATLTERQHWAESQAGLLYVYLQRGDYEEATRLLTLALETLPQITRAAIRQWVHMAAFALYQAVGKGTLSQLHLQAAHRELLAVAATLPPTERDSFLGRVPLNRQLLKAIQQNSRQVTVRLVATHVPLGRKLTPDDYTSVQWTLYSPLDEAISAKGERRRHILQRLSDEATRQGATPSDEDLAAALNVAVRTIERDLATLLAAGIQLPTRRRK